MLFHPMSQRSDRAAETAAASQDNSECNQLFSSSSGSLATPSPVATDISTSSSSSTQESATTSATTTSSSGSTTTITTDNAPHAPAKQEGYLGRQADAQERSSSSPTSQRLSSTTASRVEVRLLVRRREAGALIGKRGANIKRLRETFSGCTFNIPDTGNGPERIVCIVADSLASLEAILADIAQLFQEKSSQLMKFQQQQQHLQHLQHRPNGRNEEQIELKHLINSAHAGLLIGMGGHSIRKLRNDSKAAIKIYEMCCPQSNERVCAIKAKPSIVVSTIKMIQEIIEASPAALKASIIQKPYDALNFDLNLIDKYGGYMPDELGPLELLQLANGAANPTSLFMTSSNQYPLACHRNQRNHQQQRLMSPSSADQRLAVSAGSSFLRTIRPQALFPLPLMHEPCLAPNGCPLFADSLEHHQQGPLHHQLGPSAPLLVPRHPSARFHPYLLPSPAPTSALRSRHSVEHEQQRQIIQRHLQMLSDRQSLRANNLHAAHTAALVTLGRPGGCPCRAQLNNCDHATHSDHPQSPPAGGSCACLSASCETEPNHASAILISNSQTQEALLGSRSDQIQPDEPQTPG